MTLSRLLAASLMLAIGLGAGAAQADFLPLRPNAPFAPPAIVRVDTPISEMPPQIAHAYMVTLQKELARHGYNPGPFDGRMGPRTAAAIRAYQRAAGLPVTGVPSKELVERLMFVDTGAASGQSGQAGARLVRSVQIELLDRGYYRGPIDGIAGPGTHAAIRAFQTDEHHVVDGMVTPGLLDQLRTADPSIRAGS